MPAARTRAGRLAATPRAIFGLCAKIWQNLAAEDIDPLRLIASDIVEVDLVEAQVQELLDFAAVDLRVGRHEHSTLEVFGPDERRHLLEVARCADVLLGELHAAGRPVGDRVSDRLLVRFGPGEVELQDLRHRAWVLAGLARALLELAEDHLDLLLRRTDGD